MIFWSSPPKARSWRSEERRVGKESLARTGLPLWKGKTLDSLRLLKTTFPNLPSYNLQSLRAYFQLETEKGMNAHRAGADVEWTRQVLEIALSKAIRMSAPQHEG